MNIDSYVFFKNIPTIDLHGLNRYEASIKTNEFIKDNILLKSRFIMIIHGKGEGIVKKSVIDTLRKNKFVKEFKLDYYNSGATVVMLKENCK